MTLELEEYERICEWKLESSLIKSIPHSVLFGSGCCPACSYRHCSVQWHYTVPVSQHALRATLHIVNIVCELNYH